MDGTDFNLMMFALPFAIVGLVLVFAGIAVSRSMRRRTTRCVVSTTGVVDRIVSVYDEEDGHHYYRPMVSYIVDGVTYEVTTDAPRGSAKWSMGEPMIVDYDPSDPAFAYLPSEDPATSGGGEVLAIGALCVLIAAGAIGWALIM
ncbi:DUF3592 domain-containing protein [Bifidobacterium saguinibicoloris]|uniref:DUF3592 domain-containing protein n=1 Tax=Bifidobacterium saguinibicoloris TaxID=2834433 RepID=UPI001C58FECA|nr:DUF3592 domain-containing protein [Bifidobacterium saguinibicoloris]MBW3079945.1 DUF3592 domain-containing protein [Bifidobacterium saguinibicoloris]